MTNVEIIFTIAMQTQTALTLMEASIAFVINGTMVMEPTVHKVRNHFLICKSKFAVFCSLKTIHTTKFEFSFSLNFLVCGNENFIEISLL